MPQKKITNHAERYFAYRAVLSALQRGEIKRSPCEVCGNKGQAHHENYSKPLEIKWLCRAHHYARHAQIRAENKAKQEAAKVERFLDLIAKDFERKNGP